MSADLSSLPQSPAAPTTARPHDTPPAGVRHLPAEIKIYSHSTILYWWPVWVVGFILAIITALDGGRMVYVPPGSSVSAHQIVAPEGATLSMHERTAASSYLGTIFFITLLIVFLASNMQLRGLWEWISVLAIALVVTLISLYGMWQNLVNWFTLLHIHINLAGYVFVSVGFFAIWAASVFLFDRRTYMVVSAGQVRVLDEIGQAEKVYDVTNMTFQLQPNVFFRHRILGFYGAGDLIVRTGGPHSDVLEWPNVLFVRSRLRQIQERLKSREVV